MIARLLLFCILVAIWWAALWFALPVDLSQRSLPALVTLHVAPPLSAVLAWFLCKRLWVWRADKVAQAVAKAKADQEQAALEEAAAQRQQELERRRATLECRGIWAVVPKTPEWCKDEAAMMPPEAKNFQGDAREEATRLSLEQIFSTALFQCNALAWLPVFVVPGLKADGKQLRTVVHAWWQAVQAQEFKDASPPPNCRFLPGWGDPIDRRRHMKRNPLSPYLFPSSPECKSVPGFGEIVDRVLAQFDNDPSLPALILLGMDSPSSDAPGYALVALLIVRPGLTADGTKARESEAANPNTPYWERNRISGTGQSWWGMPAPLQPLLLQELPPWAVLHRSSPINIREEDSAAEMKRWFRDALDEALINAALREPTPEASETGKDASPESGKAEIPELGPELLAWVVHDNDDPDRLAALINALGDYGREIDLMTEMNNLLDEHGDVGAARGVLILAEAVIRAKQLQKPVLGVGFDKPDWIGIGVIRPPM
jgi:hypothetical protein